MNAKCYHYIIAEFFCKGRLGWGGYRGKGKKNKGGVGWEGFNYYKLCTGF